MTRTRYPLFSTVYQILFQKTPPQDTDLDFLLGFFEGDGGCCSQQKVGKNTVDYSY